ncbi:hypothetical protein Ancab_024178 [Ancistrocladus abbreviatus]
MQGKQHRPSARLENAVSWQDVSNAWNFDFDDGESDRADVAAFEYADSPGFGEDNPEGEFSDHARRKHGLGFDDFDDEDIDDIDSYEIDNQNKNHRQEAPSVRFSDIESESESEAENDFHGHPSRSRSSPNNLLCK